MENFEQFVANILVHAPHAQFGTDNDGQIIIYTNKMFVSDLTGEATSDIVEMPEMES